MNTSSPPPHRTSGFSLVELLIVLTLMGILSGLAAPALTGYLERVNTRSAVARLTADLNYARMLAVRSGQPATFSTFADNSYSIQTVHPTTGDPLIVRRTNMSLDYKGMTLGPVTSIQFNSRGLISGGGGAATVLKIARGEMKDSVTISPIGRVYCDGC